jgi:hypothetical protein
MESWRPTEADNTVERLACLGVDLPLGGHLVVELRQHVHGSLVQPTASVDLAEDGFQSVRQGRSLAAERLAFELGLQHCFTGIYSH